MKHLLPCFCVALCVVATAEEAATSKVRASFSPMSAGPWTGQKIVMRVELLAPGYFSGAAVFDLPEVQGVLLVPPDGSPFVSSEKVDGTAYAVQHHELAIFTRRAGTLTIPPFKIRFPIKRSPLDAATVPQEVSTPPLTITVKAPPGQPADSGLLASSDLVVTESWQPVPGSQAKLGDAFVRTIVWTATDVPGMAFPPFDPGRIEGLSIYTAAPEVEDHNERGITRGGRTDRITYVCKTPGTTAIPAYDVQWWNPASGEIRRTDFPARTIVIPGPPPTQPGSAAVRRGDRWKFVGIAFILAVGGMIAWWTRGAWLSRCRSLLPRHLPPINPTAGQSGH